MNAIEAELLDRARALLEERDRILTRLPQIAQSLADIAAAGRVLGLNLNGIPKVEPLAKTPKIGEFISHRLASSPQGITAREIDGELRKMGYENMHEKTVGMYLQRQKNRGLATRVGKIWSPLPAPPSP